MQGFPYDFILPTPQGKAPRTISSEKKKSEVEVEDILVT
jgi:hypothetical protein